MRGVSRGTIRGSVPGTIPRSWEHASPMETRASSPPRYKPLRIKKNPLLAECEEGVSILNQCAHRDLNLGPADYESDALTN